MKKKSPLHLAVLPMTLAVCQLPPDAPLPALLETCAFWCVVRTSEELSIVLPQEAALPDWKAERDWRAIQVRGVLDFTLTGILSSLAEPLARQSISIFAISTYNTDYLLLRQADLQRGLQVLQAEGFVFEPESL